MSLSLTSVFTRANRCMSAGEIYTSTEKQLLSCMLVAYQLQPRMNCSCWGVGEVNMLHSACSSKRFALHVTIKNKRNSVVKEKHFPPWLHKQVDETAKNCVQLVSSCLSIRLKLLFMSEPWNKPSTLTFLSPYSDLFIYFPFPFPCLSFLSINWPWWLNMQAI